MEKNPKGLLGPGPGQGGIRLPFLARRNPDLCRDCGTCREIAACPAGEESCLGCGACALACPYEAVEMIAQDRARVVTVYVNGQAHEVPERIPVQEALALAGYPRADRPGEGLFAPCGVGACQSCAVQIDGLVRPACTTGVRDRMQIKTSRPAGHPPRRLVGGFMGHTVGGVGTPWELKSRGFVEVACFAGGCNFRCPQCQNWTSTYGGQGRTLSPQEAAQKLTLSRHRFGVDRMAISGGECTLNRDWLICFLKELQALNPDKKARLHVDTNGSFLSPEYIDELVQAGMTDVGLDLKAAEEKTFQGITGLKDPFLAREYMETAWEAVAYLLNRYRGLVFVGVGFPYNQELISLEELAVMARRLTKIDAEVQVCVLDYRAEFRSRITRPRPAEMKAVGALLRESGLRRVLCQTAQGHLRFFA